MRCGLALCPGAKFNCFSIIPVVSFLHLHTISSILQCNTADLPSGCWVPTLPTQYLGYQRKQSTWPWTLKDSCVLFGLGDDLDFRCIDCRLVSGSHVNTQLSSKVIINSTNLVHSQCVAKVQTIPCDVLCVHLTEVLEPFLHKSFSCTILLLEFVKHFPCPNWLPQLLLENPTFGLLL